jgi:uroporphyrinogen-III synthase
MLPAACSRAAIPLGERRDLPTVSVRRLEICRSARYPCGAAANYDLEMVDSGRPARVRVCSFESRRADEMRSLLERQGLLATVAPSMRELPISDNPAAFAFAEDVLAGQFDLVAFLTGVGARTLFEAVTSRYARDEFVAALNRCTIAVRGPKPVAVLKEWGVHIDHRAPEPNTWRELLATLEAAAPLAGKRIAIQEYGVANSELYDRLTALGAAVTAVPVYRWALPENVSPLRAAIQSTIRGEFDTLLFTSAHQLVNVLDLAERDGCREAWLNAAKQCVIGSIGPTASETLREYGLPVHLEPSHPKMGTLVRELTERLPSLLPQQ